MVIDYARMGRMSPAIENSAVPAGQAVANDYDGFAEAYAAETEANLINGYYTRPAILDLAGDVAGRRILDVGCGAGPLLAALREKGAIVTGVDPSVKMLDLARQRLGEGAALHQAGLGGAPLPFPDGAFDDAIVCLVLHYLEDWKAPLADLRRVLAPGGRLIVAVNHPLVYKLLYPDAGYFAIREYSEDYTFSGQSAVLTYWHRPLHAMTDAFTAAGFRIAVISEPRPAPGAHELFPDLLKEADSTMLCFLFFVLEAV
ncbi:ubiquinone/menaquinone biosynthesis C-methylase UbiE [Nonomuraea dietziae]|uniref:Ubiquinone/menaquinone biosynthesis C-methylase UbiE n=2 Tax=Nonomuraea dietziae TaxID=65515 RepID=A0A7W5UYZ6_9ACTN|nr:ubiquinone/menaquinone biosynthesis C-methylase UbiE [Nonomuraea dietziae]